jgi:hypothetical protein
MHVQQCPDCFVLAVRIIGVADITNGTHVFGQLRIIDNIMKVSVFFIFCLPPYLFKDGRPLTFFYYFLNRDKNRRPVRR